MRKLIGLFVFLTFVGMQICFAQTREITGTVINKSDRMPLPGVTVMVKGEPGNGTATDINGKFALKIKENAILVISFIGMQTQEVSVTGKTNLTIELTPSAETLDEVMVVAYGTAKNSSFTGSAKVVSSEKLAKIQTSSITKALEGASPGVQVVSASGQPGENATIRIRGVGSINASNTPLYVVDGVPFSGYLNSINPADIESMTILKDAAANSLYGSRAANGVIVITTKKGKAGKPIVSLDMKWGINSRGIPSYDMIKNPGKYYEAAWTALRNNLQYNGELSAAEADAKATRTLVNELGGYNNYNVPDDQLVINGKLNPAAKLLYHDDWADEAFSNKLRQEYQFSYQGGSDKTKYYMSLGFLDDKGYVENSGFRRYTARVNLDQELTSWFKAGANLAYANTLQNFPNSGTSAYANQFMFSQGIAPIYPVYLYDREGNRQYDKDGNVIYDYGTASEFGYSRKYASNSNPIATQILDIHDYKTDAFDGNTYMEVSFLKDFKFRANFAYNNSNRKDIDYQNALYGDAKNVGGRAYHYQYKRDVMTFNQILSWNRDFGRHNISALAGHEAYKEDYYYLEVSKENFYYPGNPELANAAKITGATSYKNSRRIESYFAKADYSFDNRYYASLSFRRDASSRFHKDNRWGNFWAIGASWRISQENFMQNVSWIQNLKLKASYGTNGVENILDPAGYEQWYAWQDQYGITSDGTNLGLNPSYYKGNRSLTWEKSKNFNVGIETDLFDWFSLDAEYFIRKSDDLLFNRPLPPSSGFTSYPDNIGSMKNQGVEFDLTFNIFKQTEFKWSVNLNLTHYTNEITKLPPEFKESGIISGNKKYMEGHSIYDFYLERYLGVDPANGKAMYYTNNAEVANGTLANGKMFTYINSNATQEYTGDSAIPDVYGAFTSNWAYKGFDLSFMMNYQIGGKLYDSNYAAYMGNDLGSGFHKDVLKAWTPTNVNTNVPIHQQNYQDATGRSDRFLTDASFLAIKNIMLGYTFPKHICNKLHIENLRIYAVADNVALFSKRQGMDPRQYISGATGYNFAPIRTVSFGINMKF